MSNSTNNTTNSAFDLSGRVAVVTGAGKGFGRGIALCLARAGADVALAARTATEIESVATEVRALGRRAIAVPTDVTDAAQLERLAEQAVNSLGGLHIWVSNAGGLPDATPRYLTRTPEDRWDAQMDLNLKAVWMAAVVAARHMSAAAQGSDPRGTNTDWNGLARLGGLPTPRHEVVAWLGETLVVAAEASKSEAPSRRRFEMCFVFMRDPFVCALLFRSAVGREPGARRSCDGAVSGRDGDQLFRSGTRSETTGPRRPDFRRSRGDRHARSGW